MHDFGTFSSKHQGFVMHKGYFMNRFSRRKSGSSILGAALLATVLSSSVLLATGVTGTSNAGASLQSQTEGTNANNSDSSQRQTSYDKVETALPSANLSVVLGAPTGQLRSRRNVELRWLFDRPVADLGGIAEQIDASKLVTIDPAIDGKFRWASTRLLVFTPAAELLPAATVFTATLQGLSALDGTDLSTPSVLKFNTLPAICSLVDITLPQVRVSCTGSPVDEDVAKSTSLVLTPTKFDRAAAQPTKEDLARMVALDPNAKRDVESRMTQMANRKVMTVPLSFAEKGPCDLGEPNGQLCWLFGFGHDVISFRRLSACLISSNKKRRGCWNSRAFHFKSQSA